MGIGFRRCAVDHSVFIRKTKDGCMILAVFVDDILLTGSDKASVVEMKKYLGSYFVTKDMG